MPASFKSWWYLASIAFLLMAIALDCASKQAASAGMSTMAKAVGARHDGASPDVIESMHQQAQAAVHRAGTRGLIGLCAALVAGACLFISFQTRKSWWDVIPIGLFVVYVASLLILV
jgi:hypothetical protein